MQQDDAKNRDEFVNALKRSAQYLERDVTELASDLEAVAEAHRERRKSDRIIPTCGMILKDLREAVVLEGDAFVRRVKSFSEHVLTVLAHRSPMPSVHILADATVKSSLHVPKEVLVSALKSRTALLARGGQPTVFKAAGYDEQVIDLDQAKDVFVKIAKNNPARLKEHIHLIIERFEATFQISGSTNGRNAKINNGLEASADWVLSSDVVALLWPEQGKLPTSSLGRIREIIGETKFHSQPEEEKSIDKNIPEKVMTLTHQINALNEALKVIEERIFNFKHMEMDESRRFRRKELIYKLAYYPLLDWRRELVRRLKLGDYRPENENLRRMTGPILKVPGMMITNDMTLHQRIRYLVRAARPMRPAAAQKFN